MPARAAARPRLTTEPLRKSERVGRRVGHGPRGGKALPGPRRSREAAQRREREGAAGRVPARRPLTLSAPAWIQIMLPSAHRLELGGASALQGAPGAGDLPGVLGCPAVLAALRVPWASGGYRHGEAALADLRVCEREGRLGQRRTVLQLQQQRLMHCNAAHFIALSSYPHPLPPSRSSVGTRLRNQPQARLALFSAAPPCSFSSPYSPPPP